jgi:hypothetical protein
LKQRAVHAARILRTRRKQVHQQQMYAEIQCRLGLGEDLLDVVAAVFVSR